MKKVSKSDIKQAVETAITSVLDKLEISKTSKKTQKSIDKISRQIKGDWKKQARKNQKAVAKHSRNGKAHAKAEAA
jgi:tRNA U34 5-carboxymethylaminomethyl modifying GTPase MnmE/TrmE